MHPVIILLLVLQLISIWVMARNRRIIDSRDAQIGMLYAQLGECEIRRQSLAKQLDASNANFNHMLTEAAKQRTDNVFLRAELKRQHRRVPKV